MMQSILKQIIRFGTLATQRAEIGAALLIVAIVLMLILPLPIWLLDLLIAINITVSCLMVVLAMYMPSPIAFTTFPAALLITTLFRLALSVASTRLILLEADAGHIIEAFGNFVVGGNLTVGLIIFLILTVVQFLVITKGTERVAEVSARFTLDAMPGKQMAVDMDLRAGHLTNEQATAKRAAIGTESQLFGAMDGAMKFVKGDAIAGLVIVAINLIGGLSIGIAQRGMPFSEAITTYSVLTIGDGMIAQIPALLISVCAGLIITRVGGSTDSNVGRDLVTQMFSQPRALAIVALILLVFAVIPGMPTAIFLVLAALSGAIGFLQVRAAKWAAHPDSVAELESANPAVVDASVFTPPSDLSMLIEAPAPHAALYENQARRSRNALVERIGMLLPGFEVVRKEPVAAVHRFSLLLNGILACRVELRPDRLAVVDRFDWLERLGVAHEDSDRPLQLQRVAWVDPSHRELLASTGARVLTPEDLVGWLVRRTLMRVGPTFVGMTEAKRFINWAQRYQPDLAEELVKVLPVKKLSEVLQRLVSEQVPVTNTRTLLETLADWAGRERDPMLLAEYARTALRRELCHEAAPDSTLHAILVGQDVEDAVRSAIRQTAHGAFLSLEGDEADAIRTGLQAILANLAATPEPPVLLVPVDIRRYLRRFIEEDMIDLKVLSFGELTPEIEVRPVGQLTFESASADNYDAPGLGAGLHEALEN
jgi:type III secretion protein V